MPKYTFKCEMGHTIDRYVSSSVKTIPCTESTCSAIMARQMPNILNPNVTEVVDKYTGIKHIDGQVDLIKERKEEYYWTVEVPRFVNSGTYSIETMLENGWIWVDDGGKIHVNDRPPNKR